MNIFRKIKSAYYGAFYPDYFNPKLYENDRDRHTNCRFNSKVHGSNIQFNTNCQIAHRKATTYNDGIVFLDRPVNFNETVRVQVLHATSFAGKLCIGFTTTDPALFDRKNLIDLSLFRIHMRDWAAEPESFFLKEVPGGKIILENTHIEFSLNYDGKMLIAIKGLPTLSTLLDQRKFQKIITFQTTLNVCGLTKVWPIFDLYGSCSAIKLQGTIGSTTCTYNPLYAEPKRWTTRNRNRANLRVIISDQPPQVHTYQDLNGEVYKTPNYISSPVSPCVFFSPLPQTPSEHTFFEVYRSFPTQCVVCAENENFKPCVCVPCGHVTLCQACVPRYLHYEQMVHLRPEFITKCPICRAPVREIIEIFAN